MPVDKQPRHNKTFKERELPEPYKKQRSSTIIHTIRRQAMPPVPIFCINIYY